MLYLEDYLEMIEHLPQELWDRSTDMREMDLGVQNSIDILEKRVKAFFGNAKRLSKGEREVEHEAIRRDYYKTLEDADEKVQLANHMYDLVDRYLRRLDSELFKFKIELEADNSGITEVLEKRSLELDAPPISSREKENRYNFGTRSLNSHGKQKKRRDSAAGNSIGPEKRNSGEKHSTHSHGHSHGHTHNSHGHTHSHGHLSNSHRESHGRDGHNSHRDNHGHHRESHGHREHGSRDGHRESHSHRESGHGHRDSQSQRESHGHRDPHSHRDGGYSQGHSSKEREGSTHRDILNANQMQSNSLLLASMSSLDSRPGSASSASTITQQQTASNTSSPASSVSYTLGHIGAGGNAIAAAASQAIAATQQMQLGRRTASLKASYEAIHTGGVHSHDFTVGREIAGAAQTALAAIHDIPKKKKKSSSSSSSHVSAASVAATATASASTNVVVPAGMSPSSLPAVEELPMSAGDVPDDGGLDPNGEGLVDGENVDWHYDPNEPRYCLCNQVSYGDMVACDNEDCPFEWFHYQCVGITAPPKGKWYCPQCASSMKRRGRKN